MSTKPDQRKYYIRSVSGMGAWINKATQGVTFAYRKRVHCTRTYATWSELAAARTFLKEYYSEKVFPVIEKHQIKIFQEWRPVIGPVLETPLMRARVYLPLDK
jgi:hypothetical protein